MRRHLTWILFALFLIAGFSLRADETSLTPKPPFNAAYQLEGLMVDLLLAQNLGDAEGKEELLRIETELKRIEEELPEESTPILTGPEEDLFIANLKLQIDLLEANRRKIGSTLRRLPESDGETKRAWQNLRATLETVLKKYEREFLSQTRKKLMTEKKRVLEKLRKEIGPFRLFQSQWAEELKKINESEADPDLKSLRRSLLEERMQQAVFSLHSLQRDLERNRIEEQLASISVERGWLFRAIRQQKKILQQFSRQKTILLQKKEWIERMDQTIRNQSVLVTPSEEKTPTLGTALQIPEGIQENLSISQNRIDLTQGQIGVLEGTLQKESSLLEEMEKTLQQKQTEIGISFGSQIQKGWNEILQLKEKWFKRSKPS